MTSLFRRSAVACGAVAAALVASQSLASPALTVANVDFTHGATSFGYLGNQFTFTDVSSGSFDPNPVAVTTGTGAAVSSLALFGPVKPTTYFDPIRGSGHLIFDSMGQYSGFTNAPIPYSATPSFIGLALTLGDGTHYGYAEFAGTYLQTYAFETDPGIGIDAAGAVAAVPEPASMALMLAGLGAMGVTLRRRKDAVRRRAT